MDHAASPASHLERVAVEVAEIAAAQVRATAGSARATATKSSPTDIVTETDVRSERIIRTELLRRAPGSTIVGEELDEDVGANNVGWVVDPIDGTVNFLYNLPVVSVSIAATIDGIVVAGAVADVHRAETFSAFDGGGARLDGVAITANDTPSLDQALIGTGFAYASDIRQQQAQVLTGLLPACRDIRCMGSAALNLCWVGCGRLDGYFERDLKTYDFAAGALIAREGGAVVDLPGPSRQQLTFAAARSITDPLRTIVTG